MQIMHNQKLYTITFVEVRQLQNLPLKPRFAHLKLLLIFKNLKFDQVEPRHLNFKRENTIPFRFDAYLLFYDVSEPRSEEYAQQLVDQM